MTKKLDIVGPSEIATMLGVHRQQITLWRRKGTMPEPAAVLQGNRPVWYRSQIVAWAAEKAERHAEHIAKREVEG